MKLQIVWHVEHGQHGPCGARAVIWAGISVRHNNNMNNNRPHKTKSERPALAAPILAPVGLGWADWLGAAAARFLFLQKVRVEFMSNSFPSWGFRV